MIATATDPRLKAALENPVRALEQLREVYIRTKRDVQLLEKFSRLYARHCDRLARRAADNSKRALIEGVALAGMGASAAGKTRAFEYMFASFPEFAGYADLANNAPFLSVRAPPACTPMRLALTLLEALGYPMEAKHPEHKLWREVHEKLEMRKIKVVHVDEMQHATHVANQTEIARLGASLKAMLLNPRWPVMLVMVGIPNLEDFLFGYPELRRRTTICRFTDITEDDAVKIIAAAKSLCERVGLCLDLAGCDDFARRLVVASERQLGAAIDWVHEAIATSIYRLRNEDDPAADAIVDVNDFAVAFAMKRDCEAGDNPFLARDLEALILRAQCAAQKLVELQSRSGRRS